MWTRSEYGLKLVSAPAVEPLSLQEAKLFLRLDDDDTSQDDEIESLIQAARERCERVTGLGLITQQWLQQLTSFGEWKGIISLRRSPLAWDTDTDSVKYVDVNGTLTTIDPASYQIDDTTQTPTIRPAYLSVWPSPRYQPDAVQIRFTVGYGATAASVPGEIRARIKNYIGYCFEHRTDRDENFLDSLFVGFGNGAY